jgi:hypothetical protein
MADSLGVSPADLRATADRLADVSSRMKDVLSSVRTSVDAEGAPWGSDERGTEFADGETPDTGYLSQRDWVDESVEAKTSLLDAYAVSLRDAADTLESGDSF